MNIRTFFTNEQKSKNKILITMIAKALTRNIPENHLYMDMYLFMNQI